MTKPVDNGQYWVLLGTAEASTKVWGLRRIEFPCGYNMPATAYASTESPLQRPRDGDVWVMGGLALEIGLGGKSIAREDAEKHLAGYRPWIGLFHHNVLDELKEREHTIMIWDQGVSLFYGLWRDACQSLGNLRGNEEFVRHRDAQTSINCEGQMVTGESPASYQHTAADVIHFMSQFMTLSAGDTYVLGPLVAQLVSPEVRSVTLSALGIDFSVEIE
jgi:2-keto-4-pentenoate hydratase/2-oxohepta-3-ene-1,7-dioic acid hydratase in catechol pathway